MSDSIKENTSNSGHIYAAMKEWEEKTCIKFEPFDSSIVRRLGHNQRIRFITHKEGCWSYVGMQKGSQGRPQEARRQNGMNEKCGS